MLNSANRNNIDISLFNLSQIGLVLSLAGASLGFPNLNSIGVWLIFIAIMGVIVHELRNRIIQKSFFWVLIICVFSVVSILYSGIISYQSFVALFSFIEIPAIIAISRPINNNKRINTVALFALITTGLYLIAYFSDRSHLYMTVYGERTINDLTLGFSNPNESGMHLMASLYVLVSSIFYYNNKVMKLIFSLASIICAFFVFQTLSRASILVCCLFLLLLIPTVRKKAIPKSMQNIALISPFLVLILSLLFASFLSSLTWMNDSLDTGRTLIYFQRFRDLSLFQWIIGDYSYMFQNSLNSYLSVFVTVGIIPLLFFVKIIRRGFSVLNENAVCTFNKVAFLAILLTVFHSSMESACMVSGSYYAASFYGIYIMGIDGNKHLEVD